MYLRLERSFERLSEEVWNWAASSLHGFYILQLSSVDQERGKQTIQEARSPEGYGGRASLQLMTTLGSYRPGPFPNYHIIPLRPFRRGFYSMQYYKLQSKISAGCTNIRYDSLAYEACWPGTLCLVAFLSMWDKGSPEASSAANPGERRLILTCRLAANGLNANLGRGPCPNT